MEESGEDSIEASNSDEKDSDINGNKKLDSLPQRKWSELWLHASIMCGREFLYAVEIVLVTPIILQLGMPEEFYSFMWCFSPVIGVLIGPILGSKSDRCTSRFGRRRPYIVGLVIGAVIGLTLLIFSKDIAAILGGPEEKQQHLWGVIVGVVGAQSMDFCLDQAETPLRAYTLDVCLPQDQQRAFTLQTVFIGLGGALGFIIDGIDWEKTAISDLVGSQIKVVYIFAVLTYLTTTICNLISIKEIPWMKRRKCFTQNEPANELVKSHLPCVRKSKSVQPTHNSDYVINPASSVRQCLLQGDSARDTQESSTTSSVTVTLDETDHLQLPQDYTSYTNRPVTLLPRISMSKGLYLSTSCPGGLDEYCQQNEDTSLSSLTIHDPGCDEDSIARRQPSEDRQEDISCSLPMLSSKQQQTTSRRWSLLDYIRSKEFTIRSFKYRNRKTTENTLDNNAAPKNFSDATKQLFNNGKIRTKKSNKFDSIIEHNSGNVLNNAASNKRTVSKKDRMSQDAITQKLNHSKKHASNQTDTRPASNDLEVIPEVKTPNDKEHEEEHLVSLKHLWVSIITMPSQLKWLCLTQLLGFVGMETVLLWYTDLMGRVVYNGDPRGASNSTELAQYNAGVKMGCWGLTIYSLAMIIFSAAMERFCLLTKFRIRIIYSGAFLLVATTMVAMYVFTNKYVILVLSWCIGVTFAIMLTVPYVLVGKYHLNPKYIMRSPGNTRRGFGLDCAILACQMYAGNILSASLSSPIIYLSGSFKAMLLTTGTCHFVAFIIAYFCVTYPDESTSLCVSRCRKESTTNLSQDDP